MDCGSIRGDREWKELLDEKGLEEKVLEEVAMATGERDTITTGCQDMLFFNPYF